MYDTFTQSLKVAEEYTQLNKNLDKLKFYFYFYFILVMQTYFDGRSS